MKGFGAQGVPFTVVCDTREPPHTQWQFDSIFAPDGSPVTVPTVRKALATGDYSLASFEDKVAVERKTVSDLLGCIGGGRARFVRELERLQHFECPAVIVEGDLRDLFPPRSTTAIHPSAIAASLVAWSTRYRLPIWFAGGRHSAERLCLKILERFHRDVHEGKRPQRQAAANDAAAQPLECKGTS